jgi:hypothetical protein
MLAVEDPNSEGDEDLVADLLAELQSERAGFINEIPGELNDNRMSQADDVFENKSYGEHPYRTFEKRRHCDFTQPSRVSYMSDTKCVTMVENACILGEELFLFGMEPDGDAADSEDDGDTGDYHSGNGLSSTDDIHSDSIYSDSRSSNNNPFQSPFQGTPYTNLPTDIRTCGEFGSFYFSHIKHSPWLRSHDRNGAAQGIWDSNMRKPSFEEMCKNSTATYQDTLHVVTAMSFGVSDSNPYHLVHSALPAYWQLQNEAYGVCAHPRQVDVRFQYYNRRHQSKMNHFWKALTQQSKMTKMGQPGEAVEKPDSENGSTFDNVMWLYNGEQQSYVDGFDGNRKNTNSRSSNHLQSKNSLGVNTSPEHLGRSFKSKQEDVEEFISTHLAEEATQIYERAGMDKFWWGAISKNPPLPLGQDLVPRCYKKIIFGRESIRTALGGYVNQEVFHFGLDRIKNSFDPKYLRELQDLRTFAKEKARNKIREQVRRMVAEKRSQSGSGGRSKKRRNSQNRNSNSGGGLYGANGSGGSMEDEGKSFTRCDCSWDEKLLVKRECCVAEWTIARRMRFDKPSEYNANTEPLIHEMDALDHDCDFFGDPNCIKQRPQKKLRPEDIRRDGDGEKRKNEKKKSDERNNERSKTFEPSKREAAAVKAPQPSDEEEDFAAFLGGESEDDKSDHADEKVDSNERRKPYEEDRQDENQDGHQDDNQEDKHDDDSDEDSRNQELAISDPAQADIHSSALHVFDGMTPKSFRDRGRRIKIVLVQRLAKAKRHIENLNELLEYFSYYYCSVLVVYLELLTPTTQYFLARETDIWFGVTGAANAWLVFMKPGSVIIDAFPPLNGFCDPG